MASILQHLKYFGQHLFSQAWQVKTNVIIMFLDIHLPYTEVFIILIAIGGRYEPVLYTHISPKMFGVVSPKLFYTL